MLIRFILIAAVVMSALATDQVPSLNEAQKRTDMKLTMPETFGNYSLKSCSGAPACGTVMASMSGVNAYSNGADQCTGYSCGGYVSTGYQYQCVEFAQRYFNVMHGTQANWYANAIDMCANRPAGVSITSNPKAGDLVVFNWQPYGHVAVISAWYGSSFNVVEQNSSPTGTNTYTPSSGIQCYLTAGGGGGSCPSGGYYCGNNGVSGDVNTLYYCSGAGGTQSTVGCGFTCSSYPQGYDDVCVGGTCSGLGSGYYCGNDRIGGDANTLYLCSNNSPAGAKHCSNGCASMPQGTDDRCN